MAPERPTLASISLTNWKGLYTKTSPELLEMTQCRTFENADLFFEYGSATKLAGSKRLLLSNDASNVVGTISGGVYQEGGTTRPLSWVGFYKYPDLDGQILRRTIAQCGTTIQEVDYSSGLITELSTGHEQGLIRTAAQFDQFLFVTGQDVEKIANRDGSGLNNGFKYDGTQVSPWGVIAPGSTETSSNDVETFDSTASFVTSNCSITTDANTAWKDNSIKVTKAGASTDSHIEKAVTSFAVNTSTTNRMFVYLYIPRASYQLLMSDSGGDNRAISIYISSNGDVVTNYYRFDWQVGRLVEGWNQLFMDFTAAPTGDFGTSVGTLDTANIDFIRWEVRTTLAASTPDVFWDHQISLDQGSVTAAMGTGSTTELDFESLTQRTATFTHFNDSVAAATGTLSLSTGAGADPTPIEGSNSYKFVTSATTDLNSGWESTAASLTPALGFTDDDDKYFINVWFDADELAKLEDTDRCLSFYFGSSGATNFTEGTDDFFRIDFFLTDLVADQWNTLTLDFTQSPRSGNPDVTAIDAMRTEVIALSADMNITFFTDQLGSVSGTGPFPVTTSTWRYKVTYVTRDGLESNAGPFSAGVSNSSGLNQDQIDLTNIPISPQTHVVARKIYRTVAGGTETQFLTTINDNVTTTFTDTISDGALGVTSPPQAGEQVLDNSPPPSAGIIQVWKRTVFLAGDPQNPQVLYFSRDDLPEAFPLFNAFELDSKITGIYETYLGLVVTTETAYWRVLGNNPDYVVDKIVEGYGAVGPRAVGASRVVGWAVDRDGMRLYDLRDALKVSEVIRDKWDDGTIEKVNIERMHTVYSRRFNTYLQFCADDTTKTVASTTIFDWNTIFAYQHALDDVRNGWWSQVVPNASANLNFTDTIEIEDTNGDFHILATGDDGQLYELLAPGETDWQDAAGTAFAMNFKLVTPYFRAGPLGGESQAATGRFRPRFIEMRVDEANQAASTWTITVEMSNGPTDESTVYDSQVLSFVYAAGETMKQEGLNITPARYMRITVENTETGKENLRILGIRIPIEVFPDERAI